MNIAVVGTGYVGLVTGTCFAETGNNVICVDIDKEKVKRLQCGNIPIYEPHLEGIFQRNIKSNRLSFTTNLKDAIEKSLVIFLALPTPPDENGSADLTHVLDVANQLGKLIKEYKVVVNKSTVPVGTAELVRKAIAKNCSEGVHSDKTDFDVVSNPEFLREGFAVDDFMKPDRVVVGTSSERAKKVMEDLYKPFVRQGNPILFMDEKSSELTKYAANSFLATKISFMNEIANLCEKVGADVDKVRMGIGSDDRIGKRFLFAGIGYGGSCFPKDVLALAKSAEDNKYDFKILKSVMEVNKSQRELFLERIKKYFKNNLKGKKIALWGIAFKPDTDDIREAPALYLIEELLSAGAKISVYDPEAMNNVKKVYDNKISFGKNHYEVLKGADALLICTEWAVFRTPDFEEMKKLMQGKIIFDGRNLYSNEQMKQLGFIYSSIGR
ncbi:MAG: UDP-glucose/GDP-mannose dehydrogenase family protein [Bacteroidetes bacterium]|nr:UDP-glucose/GDP-mannose dehydrogenase family protein [Bacteroidota bacterium]